VLALLLTGVALTWAALILSAPVSLARGGAASLGAAAVYSSASRICHQRPERSFHLAGIPLPVCGRCSGLYLSGALGALLAWAPGRRRHGRSDRLVLAACAAPTALTWMLEQAGVFGFSNEIRALAGVPLGAAASWIFVRSLRDETARHAPAAPVRPGALS
jgi:uncharacterized membrane protein